MSSRVEEKAEILRCGYALNPKKLRPGDASSSSSSSSSPMHPCKEKQEGKKPWCGGGLADILLSTREPLDGVLFEPWDPDVAVAQQPHFHVLIHKLTEDIDRVESRDKLLALEEYLRAHPDTVIVDPIDAVRNVISRARTNECLRRIHDRLQGACPFRQPRFVIVEAETAAQVVSKDQILNLMRSEGLTFPVICKPLEGCGTPISHSMVVVVSEHGLDLVRQPCVVQQFCDHDATFFKVYVIDDDVMVFTRPSLPNLLEDKSTILAGEENSLARYRSVAFDSRYAYPTIDDFIVAPTFSIDEERKEEEGSEAEDEQEAYTNPKRKSSSERSSPLVKGEKNNASSSASLCPAASPSSSSSCSSLAYQEQFRATAAAIRQEFGLTLFGFDAIVPSTSSLASAHTSLSASSSSCAASIDLVVVDVNFFPSYKEVSNFPTRLRSFLRKAGHLSPWE